MTTDESFADLIVRLRAGEQQAVAELLHRYEPEIRRLIRLSLTNNKLRRIYESADIFQSVFTNFYVRLMSGQFDLEKPGQLIQLLATMARNRVVDHARRACNRQVLQGTETLAETVGREQSPSAIVASLELLQKVRGLLSEDELRLAQARAEGASWQELACVCGGTPDALRKKLERALDRVCQQLEPGEVSRE